MSKKDYYLYVYEPQGKDTTLIARYDCAFSLKKGQKEKEGDMRTPHCTIDNPFHVQQIVSASNWEHDFGDGRGKIKSYGDYFLRLKRLDTVELVSMEVQTTVRVYPEGLVKAA